MATTYQLLDKAEQLELLACELYLELAGRYSGGDRALFERLSEEEGQHAARVRLLKARYRQDSRVMTADAADAGALDRLLEEASAGIAAVKAGRWDGDARAAFIRAAEMEERFAVAHAQTLSQDSIPGLRAFFEQLAAQDRGHKELLGSSAGAGLR
jgi:rubrerythrin